MQYKDILLVDDDTDDTEIFMEAVNALGKDIVFRSENNALKALEGLRYSSQLPDLIFLDYNMPMMNGKEFLMQIKSEQLLQDIPVILISSPSEEFAKDLLKRNEIIHYISKPSNYNELITILGGIL